MSDFQIKCNGTGLCATVAAVSNFWSPKVK